MSTLSHPELVNLAQVLLKNRGFKDIRKEFPSGLHPLAKKYANYKFDACAIKNRDIVAVAECGYVSAEKMKFLISRFKENFIWIPLSAIDYIYFIEETKSQKRKQLNELKEKLEKAKFDLKNAKKNVETAEREYQRIFNKRQQELSQQKEKMERVREQINKSYGILKELVGMKSE